MWRVVWGLLVLAVSVDAVVEAEPILDLGRGAYELNAYPENVFQIRYNNTLRNRGPLLQNLHLQPLVLHSPSNVLLVNQTTTSWPPLITPINATHDTVVTSHRIVVSTAATHLDALPTYTVCVQQPMACNVPVPCAPTATFAPTGPNGAILPVILSRDGIPTAVGVTATFWAHNTTSVTSMQWSIPSQGWSGTFVPPSFTLPPAITTPGTATLIVTATVASTTTTVGTVPLLFVQDYNGAVFSHRIHGADVLVVMLPPHRARNGVAMPPFTASTPVPRATLRYAGNSFGVPATWCVANGTCAWEDRDAMWCAWDQATVTVEIFPTFFDDAGWYLGSDPRTFTITNVVAGASPARCSPLWYNAWFPQDVSCAVKGASSATGGNAILHATTNCGNVSLPFTLPTLPSLPYPANLTLQYATAPMQRGVAFWPNEVTSLATNRIVGIVNAMVTQVQFALPPGHAITASWLSKVTMRQVNGSATLTLNCSANVPVSVCTLPPDCNQHHVGAYVGYLPWVMANGTSPLLCPGAENVALLSIAMAVHYGGRAPTGALARMVVNGIPTFPVTANVTPADLREAENEQKKRDKKEEIYFAALGIAGIIVVAGGASIAIALCRRK